MCGIIGINLETLMAGYCLCPCYSYLSASRDKWHYLIGSAIMFYINLKHNNYNIG